MDSEQVLSFHEIDIMICQLSYAIEDYFTNQIFNLSDACLNNKHTDISFYFSLT